MLGFKLHAYSCKFLLDAAHEDDVLKFKEEMNSTKKTAFSENVELIRLKRENKEKEMAYHSMEAR